MCNKTINEKKIAHRTSFVTILGNLLLSAFKFVAGLLSMSQALISDAIDSLGDVVSSFIVMIGLKISSKKEDEDHPFGHERFEPVATIILAIMLFLSGGFIGYQAIKDIIAFFKDGVVHELSTHVVIGLVAAIVSIIGKEAMFWYTRNAGKKIHSEAFIANAWNYRMDALSSIGSLIGIIGAMCGFPILDAFASLIICIFILITSIKVFIDAINRLVDKACDESIEEKMRSVILSLPGVLSIDLLKTRIFGSKIYVDVEISVRYDLSVLEGHKIAEAVHHAIEDNFEDVKHCMVHVNPNITSVNQ